MTLLNAKRSACCNALVQVTEDEDDDFCVKCKSYYPEIRDERLSFAETERSLVLLTSILLDKSGGATKEEVLDNIESRGYLKFDDHDKEYRANGELVWKNDLAWTRSDLVESGYMSGEVWDDWRITKVGKVHFRDMVKNFKEKGRRVKLTENWINRINEWLSSV